MTASCRAKVWTSCLFLSISVGLPSDCVADHEKVVEETAHSRSSSATSESELMDRFRREAPNKWKALESVYMHMRGVFTRTDSTSLDGQPTTTNSSRTEFAYNGYLMKSVTTNSRHGDQVIQARNENYVFSIRRPAAITESPFTVEFLEPIGSVGKIDDMVAERAKEARYVVTIAWHVFDKSFFDWEKTEGFKLKEFRQVDGLLRVQFDCHPAEPDTKKLKLSNVYALYDPQNHWLLREYGANLAHPTAVKATFEYGEPMSVVEINPLLRERLPSVKQRLVEFTSAEKPNDRTVMQHDYEGLRIAVVPPEEFRLAYYGLSEPGFVSIWRYEIIGIAMVVAAIGSLLGAFVWLRRRRTPPGLLPVNDTPTPA